MICWGQTIHAFESHKGFPEGIFSKEGIVLQNGVIEVVTFPRRPQGREGAKGEELLKFTALVVVALNLPHLRSPLLYGNNPDEQAIVCVKLLVEKE